jgi:hypothetical protein
MASLDKIIGDLSDISAFLETRGEVERAYRIRHDIEVIESNSDAAAAILLGLDYWGSLGSHADLSITRAKAEETVSGPDPGKVYNGLLYGLGTDLINAGMTSRRLVAWREFLKANS